MSWIIALPLALVVSQDSHSNWDRYFWISAEQSVKVLGTQEGRHGFTMHLQNARPDPVMNIRKHPGQFVWEGYASFNWGGIRASGKVQTASIGGLGLLRHVYGSPGHRRWFWEAGWGLQYTTETSIDLPSQFNSTPTIGIGWIDKLGNNEILIALRFFHISNAGTKGSNNGQNIVKLMVGVKV